MGVIPGHKISRAMHLRQIRARNVERLITIRTGCKNHRIIVLVQVRNRDVSAHVHVTQQADITTLQNLVQGHNDLFDTRVIWRNTVTHQTVRRGKLLE